MRHSVPVVAAVILLLAGCSPVQLAPTPMTATPVLTGKTSGFTPGPIATVQLFIASETPGLAYTTALQGQQDPLTQEWGTPTSAQVSLPTSQTSQVREIDLVDRLATDPAAYQTDFTYLTSPQYLEDLRTRDARGETPGMSTTVIYLEPYDPGEFARAEKTMLVTHYDDNSLRLQQEGFDTIFHLTQGILYVNRDSRPFVLEDVRMTEINGTPALFYTMKWENRDGTFGYVSHVWMPRPGEALREEAIFATGLGDSSLLVNGLFFAGHTHCMQTLRTWGANPEGVCNWYMDPEQGARRREVYTNWQETGILTNTLADGSAYLPVSPGVLSEIKEDRVLDR